MSYQLKPFSNEPLSFTFKSNISIKAQLLSLDFDLYSETDEVANLNIPKFNLVERKDKLWKSTCMECFLFFNENDYCEVNISPSGAWNSYYFTSYRTGMEESQNINLTHISTSFSSTHYHLEASFDFLEKRYPEVINLCAILESKNKEHDKSYWAIKHNKGQPDFHLKELGRPYRWF